MRTAIVNGFRTGFCRQGTLLKDVSPDMLGAAAVKEMVRRLKLMNISPSVIDFVAGSNVATPPNAPNIARVAAVKGGLPENIPAKTLNQNCGSGIAAVDYGSMLIEQGRYETVLVVGVESMSNIPMLYPDTIKKDFESLAFSKASKDRIKIMSRLLPKQLQFWKKEFMPKIGLIMGLTDPICDLIMGLTAENLAKDPSLQITREEQDSFAVNSHRKAFKAQNDKRFSQEITELFIPGQKAFLNLDQDNGIRTDAGPAMMAKLKPFFDRRYGSVTAGNSSQITDGASCILLMSDKKAKLLGLPVLGYVVDYAEVGFKPEIMGLSPVGAIAKILQKNDKKLKDFGVVEINEAFAAQVLACLKVMASDELMTKYFASYGFLKALGEVSEEQLNPRGGAIALGHPVGVSGMRLIITALNELRDRGQEYGLVSACIGGGQGNAMIVRRS